MSSNNLNRVILSGFQSVSGFNMTQEGRISSLLTHYKPEIVELEGDKLIVRFFISECKPWARSSLARFLQRRIVKPLQMDVCDSVISQIVSQATEFLDSPFKFYEVTGEEIVEKYRQAFGESSCMTYEDSPVELYAATPDKIAMLCCESSASSYTGRAILWTADCGQRLLDRVYTGSDRIADQYEVYARDNGILVRDTPNHYGIARWGCGHDKGYSITINVRGIRAWPYFDTMTYCLGNPYRKHKVTLVTRTDQYQRSALGFVSSSGYTYAYCPNCNTMREQDRWVKDVGIDAYICGPCADSRGGRCSACGKFKLDIFQGVCPVCLDKRAKENFQRLRDSLVTSKSVTKSDITIEL